MKIRPFSPRGGERVLREHGLIYGPNRDTDFVSPLTDSPFNLMVDISQGFFDIRVILFSYENFFRQFRTSLSRCTNWARTPIIMRHPFCFGFPG